MSNILLFFIFWGHIHPSHLKKNTFGTHWFEILKQALLWEGYVAQTISYFCQIDKCGKFARAKSANVKQLLSYSATMKTGRPKSETSLSSSRSTSKEEVDPIPMTKCTAMITLKIGMLRFYFQMLPPDGNSLKFSRAKDCFVFNWGSVNRMLRKLL